MDDPYQTLLPKPIRVEQRAPEQPQRIGRYRVERVLGEGGFGLVYLAHDDQLQRPVAIKVPHHHLVSCPEDAEAYLTEARTVASLDHPHIVPVYDVGSTEDFPCFVVSKFIAGSTLIQRIKANRPSWVETVELVATVAETLSYAHKKGLVHRDIKPGNILLDTSGQPFVADFGLALREADVGKGPRFAGTPAYMSPEQARAEGHRVDGRSDLFSLGVVFYELLTGRLPFKADKMDELLEQVKNNEARPPRQWDDAIPKELERICLKALAKRAADRYSTGKDMAEDLRHFFHNVMEDDRRSLHASVPAANNPTPAPAETPVPSHAVTPAPESGPVRIVPKGLRSFDAHDADFFLELLPGPRDRAGLPDSIRFWKNRIEERDADNAFAVGLIYGPSGCGKSSLVKAGLLPRLSRHVLAVYVEAAADETETRLLNGLRKRCPALPANLGLKETLALLRRDQGVLAGQKVLIVLDQFEQWLHARKEEQDTELVQALRQCDGSRVQCIVLVRDDFWMAVTRFMQALEVEPVPGKNTAAVDLFDTRHARKILTAFGRAFGALPEALTREQESLLDQAVSGLAQENKIISVRLSLFAEMMKGKSWTPATLREVGGTAGVGVTFLEETFSSSTANPRHRLHQRAARAVLKSLLPESGTDIKGHLRSHADLLAASGYASRPKDFEDLLRILDGEIRLITPTDPEGKEGESVSRDAQRSADGAKYYQLTHDYLVPSVREWLIRKQKETRRGRAELRLTERAAAWQTKRENRHLPAWWEWLNICLFTRKRDWTEPQRKMMRRAGRYHGTHGLLLLLAVVAAGGGFGWAWWDHAAQEKARREVMARRLAETKEAVLVRLSKAEDSTNRADQMSCRTSREARAVLVEWGKAEAALAEAEAALGTGAASDELRRQLAEARQRIESGQRQTQRQEKMFRDLDDARMTMAMWKDTQFDYANAAARFKAAFAEFGLKIQPGRTEDLAQRIRSEAPLMQDALIVALDHWAFCLEEPMAANLLAIAQTADENKWRQAYRKVVEKKDSTALVRLSKQAHLRSLPPVSLHLLALALYNNNRPAEARELLRWARGLYPGDFWIAFHLGAFLLENPKAAKPVVMEEGIGCLRVAVALRPDAGVPRSMLAVALLARNLPDEAIAEFKRALVRDPKLIPAHIGLGMALAARNQLEEAIAEHEKTLALSPKLALTHIGLGLALEQKNQLDKAIAEYQKAIDIDPNLALAHFSLGLALAARNQLDRAITEYQKAIDIDPQYAVAHSSLGMALAARKKLKEAIDEYNKAIDLDPRIPSIHYFLGHALVATNQRDKALIALKKAIHREPNNAFAYYDLGGILGARNQLDDAITAYRKAIDIEPKFVEAHENLGVALMRQGLFAKAEITLRHCLTLRSARDPKRAVIETAIKQAQCFLQLEKKLPSIVSGDRKPADTAECLDVFTVCQIKQLNTSGARFFKRTFADRPALAEDLDKAFRYNAVCFAALAAAGKGKDADRLTERERDELRKQALQWLRADLAAWREKLNENGDKARPVVQRKMTYWKQDADLAGVRDPQALAKLPPAERDAWQKLWNDVDSLLARSRQRGPEKPLERP